MDKIKILLVEPGDSFAEDGCFVLGKQTPSIGLAYIAAYLSKDKRIQVKLFDQQIARGRPNQILSILKEFLPDVVGIQAFSYNFGKAKELATVVKETLPECKVLMGGTHPSVCPEDALEEADAVIIGDGELAVLQYCQDLLENKETTGIIKVDNKEKLDDYPFPNWSLIPYHWYRKAFSYSLRKMEFLYPISTSRNCCFACSYCSGSIDKVVKKRSPESVIKELLQNYEQGARFFYFVDPNFLIDKDRAEEICRLIRKEIIEKYGARISWKCQSRACFGDRDLYKKMKLAGCELIFFGIESGNDIVLANNKPNQTRQMIKLAVKDAKWGGLRVRGSFVLGLPFDTAESVMETISFAKELDLDGVAFHTLDIYPGTKIWHNIKQGISWGGIPVVGEEDGFSRGKAKVGVNDLSPEDINVIKATISSFSKRSTLEDEIRRNLSELKYYLDHDKVIFRKICKDYVKELSKQCQEFLFKILS